MSPTAEAARAETAATMTEGGRRATRMWGLSEVRRGWRSLLAAAVIVAMASGGVMAAAAGARRAGSAVDRYIAATDPADVAVFTERPLDASLRARMQADPRVERLTTGTVAAVTPTAVFPLSEGGLWLQPADAIGAMARPVVTAGRLPTGPGEIAMSESAARGTDYAVGDEVDLHSIEPLRCFRDGECTPLPAGSAIITGIVRVGDELVPDPQAWLTFLGVGDPARFDADGSRDVSTGGYTAVWVVPGADVAGLVGDYAELVTDGDVTVETGRGSPTMSSAFIAADTQRDALLMATAIAAVVAVLVISQTHSRFLARRRSDVATLAAIGMTRRDCASAACWPGFVAALGAGALSIPVAVLLSPLFPLGMARRVEPDVGLRPDLPVLLGGAVMTVAVATVAAVAASVAWSRKVPAVAADVTLGARVAAALRAGPAAATGARFALERRVATQRLPVVSTAAVACAAVALGSASVTVTDNIDTALTTPSLFGANWDLLANVERDVEESRAFVASDDRIDTAAYAETGELQVSVDGRSATVYALGIETLKGPFTPVVVDGRAPAAANEVGLVPSHASALDVGIGDRIAISGPDGATEALVTGLTILAGDYANRALMVVPLETLRRLGGDESVATIDLTPIVVMSAREAALVEDLRADLDALGAGPETPRLPARVGTLSEIRNVPLYVAAFVGILAMAVLLHALTITARRRGHDLAVLRALGMRPRRAGSTVHVHSAVVSAIASVVGLAIGIAAGRALWHRMASDRTIVVAVDVPWTWIAVAVSAGVAVAVIVLPLAPARGVRRRSPADDVRSE